MYRILVIIIVLCFVLSGKCNDKRYTLDDIIEIAVSKSPEYRRIKTIKENSYWKWKYYRSLFKPSLNIEGTIPSFENNSIPVYMSDGSIEYRKVKQSSSMLKMNLEQALLLTGGKVFLSSDIKRIDNLESDKIAYNGSPLFIGIEQPIFGFNQLKWIKRIESVRYKEQMKKYTEEIERIAVESTSLFFEMLLAQINMQIADNNLNIAEELHRLGQEKYKLGKISRNELLQLKFSVISAKKSGVSSGLAYDTSLLALKTYLGLNSNFGLVAPDFIPELKIDESEAVTKAMQNNSKVLNYKRQKLEAERDYIKAKKENGFKANLQLSVGLNNISDDVNGIYKTSGKMQTVNLSLKIPVLDWGRRSSAKAVASANKKLVDYTVEQAKINFEQSVISEIKNFKMYSEFINQTKDADLTASERYTIAKERYLADDISHTELNISQQEKDKAKQDYIYALKGFWISYYNIRSMTLYDFKNNRELLDVD